VGVDTAIQREVASAGGQPVSADFLQSLFVAELIAPSTRLWLISPWLADIELVDNRARQFSSLFPDWPVAYVRLSRVLETMLQRGAHIVVIMNQDERNNEFARTLHELTRVYPYPQLRVERAANLHEKGIVGDHFSLSGSMNLTYHGVYVNEEQLLYTTDLAQVAERRLRLAQRWGEAE